jgi:hypothetical protein
METFYPAGPAEVPAAFTRPTRAYKRHAWIAVGRWVYTAQQIAANIVGRRDALDGFLRRLSRSDVRIAWVGWLLGMMIWALRAVVDAVFRLVVIAQRALSREYVAASYLLQKYTPEAWRDFAQHVLLSGERPYLG